MPPSSQKTTFLSNSGNRFFDKCRQWIHQNRSLRCLLCDAGSAHHALCAGCWNELPWLDGPRCQQCAHPLPAAGTCGRCINDLPHFDAVTAACRYAYPLDGLIQACKYGGRMAMLRALAEILMTALPQQPDLIVPMPLSDQRLRERGFNQAFELARHAAQRTGVPLDAGICIKTRDTLPQSTLPWKERRKNIRGAFVVQHRLDGLHIVVVDDVLTTGATLGELARNLKKSGAASVTGWVVGRTVAGQSARGSA